MRFDPTGQLMHGEARALVIRKNGARRYAASFTKPYSWCNPPSTAVFAIPQPGRPVSVAVGRNSVPVGFRNSLGKVH